MKVSFRNIATLSCAVLMSATLLAQSPETPAQKAQRMKWWTDARFGLFIHWGLYSVPAGEWKGETGYGEWIRDSAKIPVAEYEKFRDQFNPVKFDADKWVSMAKAAGMKYITITTKHHDGFNLFPSKYTDWSIAKTPFKRDVMKEIAAAARKYGLKICWYHSIMDWHHPDYLPRRPWETDRSTEGADFNRFVKYLHNEVTQILTEYGPIGVIWFDGQWEGTWNPKLGKDLYQLCRKLQPGIIVNDRTAMQANIDYGTPEQYIPATGIPNAYWETCMTMNDHWGYNSHDLNYKPAKEMIRMLVDIASKGGNYLLNIGPTAEGEFPPLAVQRLKEIGAWTKVNGEAIYGTQASVFKGLPWGRCTVKKQGQDSTLYLHVFDWPKGPLALPGLYSGIKSVRLLADPKAKISVATGDGGVSLLLPKKAPADVCSVIAVNLKGQPLVFDSPVITPTMPTFLTSTTVSVQPAPAGFQVRYTTDGTTPTASSTIYTKPLTFTASTTVTARLFKGAKAVTNASQALVTKASLQPALEEAKVLEGSVRVQLFRNKFEKLSDIDRLSSETLMYDSLTIGLGEFDKAEDIALRFTGYVLVPANDLYTFELSSDDGSGLWIDGKPVVLNDGLHNFAAKTGIVALAAGPHRLRLDYFNRTGGSGLELKWAQAGKALRAIASEFLGR